MKKIIYLLTLSVLFLLMGCSNKSNKNEYITKDFSIKHGEYLLDAEVLIPISKDQVPAVVLVGGSGPTDMDSSVGKLKPFKDISKGLAKKGIASIRFNKITYQFNMAKEYGFTIDDEYINDIKSAVNILKEIEEIDSTKIYLLGHSLGSQIVPIIANEDRSIKGLIIMAGTTEHLIDVLLEQTKKQSEDLYNQYLPIANIAKSLKSVESGKEQNLYLGGYTAYWVSYNSLPLDEISNINKPILIMQGALDLQVSVSHFDKYKTLLKNKANVNFKFYNSLNHCFTDGTNETILNAYTEYSKVPSEVINDIAHFINKK